MTEPVLDIVGVGLACVDILIRLGEMPTWEKPTAEYDAFRVRYL